MYFVYLLRCKDSTLYCGITNDLDRRLSLHNSGKGAKYTHGRLPVKLSYWESAGSRTEALKRERAIKKMPKNLKELLAKSGKKL
jgi:predicted GIY-YIG superfamily endonuclease